MQDSDRVFQLSNTDQLLRRERSHSNHQSRLENAQLSIEMCAAVRDLRRVGNAIAPTLRVLPGKAADHGADVHPLSKIRLGNPQLLREPSEHAPSGRIR